MVKQLFKVEFLNMMNNFSYGKSKKKIGGIGILLLLAFMCVYYSGMYGAMLANMFEQAGAMEIFPLYIFLLTSMVVLMFSIMGTSNSLFQFKDYDLLLSLPISRKLIITAKMLYIYVSNLAFSLMIVGTTLVVGVMYGLEINEGFAYTIASIIFIPIIPICIAMLLGLLISYLSKFFKARAIFSVALTFGLIAAIMAFQNMVLTMDASDIQAFNVNMKEKIFKFYPISIFYNQLSQGEIIGFILFALISIGVGIVFVVIVSKTFIRIHEVLQSSGSKSTSKVIKIQSGTIFLSLLKKEAKLLFATPVYLMNALAGVLLGGGALVYILIKGEGITAMIQMVPIFGYFVSLVIALVVGIFPTTVCSLSLEGKSFYILKSLPVRGRDILMAKVVFNLIINLPICILASVVTSVLFKFDIVETIINIIFPISFCLIQTVIGLWLNIKMPNFEWTNPTIVVKQSVPGFVVVFGAMGIIGIPTIILNVMKNSFTNLENIGLIFMVVSISFIIIAMALLHNMLRKSDKIIRAL